VSKTYRSILVIGDLHFPYHHPDTFKFLIAMKSRYKPDKVISIGDEIDGQGWSFHEKSSELMGGGDEFLRAQECMWRLEEIFPEIDILESNHGSLQYRKAQSAGLPSAFIKDYRDVWNVGEGFSWHHELTLDLPNKQKLYLHHSKSSDVMRASQMLGMNVVFGHHHNKQSVQYWTSGHQTMFGAFTGCLVDVKSLAQAYAKNNLQKPLLGSLAIQDSIPHILRMNVDGRGRWKG